MRGSVERERKLVPSEGFELPALGRELAPQSFVSTYHDTGDLRLARRGVTLRHRSADGAGVWQLKLPRGATRLGLEEPGPPARPPQALLDLLPAHLRGTELVRVARLRTLRRRLRVDGVDIVDDTVGVLDGRRITARFRELEIELRGEDESALHEIEQLLRDAGAEPAPLVPKVYRALDLEHPDSTRQALSRALGPAQILRAALGEQYALLLDHDPGTRLGTDPEDLHQLRVATRRARAYLRAARPLLERAWADGLRAELGWLGSALGPARDLDVLLVRLRDGVAALSGEDAKAARALVEALEREHADARGAALQALSDDRYFRLLDRLEHVEPELVSTPGTEFTLRSLWWREFRRTRRYLERLGKRASDAELHEARIRVKRARYAAELAAPDLGRRGERFVAAAKRLQDVLGTHQDACVAQERIEAWAGAEPRVARRLVALERERRRKARRRWPDAWAELDRVATRARRA